MSGCICSSVAFAKLWKMGAAQLCSKNQGAWGRWEGKTVLSTNPRPFSQKIQYLKNDFLLGPWMCLRLSHQHQGYLDGKLDKSTLGPLAEMTGVFPLWITNSVCMYVSMVHVCGICVDVYEGMWVCVVCSEARGECWVLCTILFQFIPFF